MKTLLFLSLLLLLTATTVTATSADSVLAQYCGKTVGELSGLSTAGTKPTKTWFENNLFEPLKALLDVACQDAVVDSGNVYSVGLAMPDSECVVTNSPVISDGTLTMAWIDQEQNYVFAAPKDSAGTPSFRRLYASDIYDISSTITEWDGLLDSKDVAAQPADSSVMIQMRVYGDSTKSLTFWKGNGDSGVYGETAYIHNFAGDTLSQYIEFYQNSATPDYRPIRIWPALNVDGILRVSGPIYTCPTIDSLKTRCTVLEKNCYGSLVTYDASTATTIDSANVWRQINTFTTVGAAGHLIIEVYAGTTDDYLAATTNVGDFNVDFNGSFTCGTTSVVVFEIFIDAVAVPSLRRTVTVTSGATIAVNIHGLATIASAKKVVLKAMNKTGAHDITMVDGNLSINRIIEE